MAVTDKSVYLDTGQRQLPQPVQQRQDRDALDRPVGPVEHQLRRAVRRDLPARATTATTRRSPAPTSTCSSTTRAPRADAAFDFITWLTSAKVHLKFAIATGDLPLRKSETKLPGLPDVPEEVPRREGLRRQPRQRQARPARTSPSYAAGVDGHRDQMVQSVLLGQAQPARGAELGRRRRSLQRSRLVSRLVGGHLLPHAPAAATAAAGRVRRRGLAHRQRRGHRLGDGRARASSSSALFGLVPVVWAFVLSFQHNDLQTPGAVGRAATTTGSWCTTRCSATRCGTPSSTPLLFVPDHPGAVAARRGRPQPAHPRDHASTGSRSSSRSSPRPSRPASSSPG